MHIDQTFACSSVRNLDVGKLCVFTKNCYSLLLSMGMVRHNDYSQTRLSGAFCLHCMHEVGLGCWHCFLDGVTSKYMGFATVFAKRSNDGWATASNMYCYRFSSLCHTHMLEVNLQDPRAIMRCKPQVLLCQCIRLFESSVQERSWHIELMFARQCNE